MQQNSGKTGSLSPLAMFSRSFIRKGKSASPVQGPVKVLPSFPWTKTEPAPVENSNLSDGNNSCDVTLPLSVQPGDITPPKLSAKKSAGVDSPTDFTQDYLNVKGSPIMNQRSPSCDEDHHDSRSEVFPASWARSPPHAGPNDQDVGKENLDKNLSPLSRFAPPRSPPTTKSSKIVHSSLTTSRTPPAVCSNVQRAGSQAHSRGRSASLPPVSPRSLYRVIDRFSNGQQDSRTPYDGESLDMDACSSEETIKVLVRVRPLNDRENSLSGEIRCLKQETRNSILFLSHPEPQHYVFDSVLGENVSQEAIFRGVGGPIVEKCLSGYNSSIFAYGQTGSGKTHTMLGNIESLASHKSEDRGLTPRVFEYLFERIVQEESTFAHERLEFMCKCSFLEIYNEQVADLLDPSSTNLQIREDAKRGIFVEGLKEVHVQTVEDVIQLIVQGAANRRTGATNMNRESSRSHSVFTCLVESKRVLDSVINLRFSKLNLIDLAGSERQKSSGAEGERLKEAGKINKSLLQLGNVIKILTDGHASHVPYRDSRLTFLLKESLGGNSKTTMIANISPSVSCFGETLSTLRFAHKVKNIRNRAVVNEDTTGDVASLKKEIHRLKEELRFANSLVQKGHVTETPLSTHMENHTAIVPFEQQTPPRRSASKKMKAMEAVLAGALRREQAAEEVSKRLAAEIQQLNRLVRQREQDTQSGKLVLKFRDEKIRRLEALSKGNLSKDTYLEQDNESLVEELNLLRAQLDRNPEVTRFALENLRLVEQLRKYQEFCEGGEREAMAEDIENLREQLADMLEGRGSELTPPVQRSTTPYITQMELYKKDAEEAQNKLLMVQESNLHLQNQVQALTEEVERLLDVQTSLRADLGSQKELLLLRSGDDIIEARVGSSANSRCPKKSLADAFASVGGEASVEDDSSPAAPVQSSGQDEIDGGYEHGLRVAAERKLAQAHDDLQDALFKLEDKAVLQEALEDAQANILEELAQSRAECGQLATQVDVLQQAQVELARAMEKAKEEAIMERMMLEKEGERAENLESELEELEEKHAAEKEHFMDELQKRATHIATLDGISTRLQDIMERKLSEELDKDETRSDAERETALALASLQEEIREAHRLAEAAAAEKESDKREVMDSTHEELALCVQELQEKVAALEETVTSLTLERDQIQESLDVLREEKESLQAQLEDTEAAVLSARQDRDEAKAALDNARRETNELKAALSLAENYKVGDGEMQERAALQQEDRARDAARLAEDLAEARRDERLAQVALRAAEERLQAAIAAQEEKCRSLEENHKAEVTAKEEELSKLQWKLDVGTAAKTAAESDLTAANTRLEELTEINRGQEEKAQAEQREHNIAEARIEQLQETLEVTVAEREDMIERLKEQLSAAAAAQMEAEDNLTRMKIAVSEHMAAPHTADVIAERDNFKFRVDFLEAEADHKGKQLLAAKEEAAAELAHSNHLAAQIVVLEALVAERAQTYDSATQTESAYEAALSAEKQESTKKELENTIAGLKTKERNLEETVGFLKQQLQESRRRIAEGNAGKGKEAAGYLDAPGGQENVPCIQPRAVLASSPKFGNGSAGDSHPRVQELEEQLRIKQKEVTNLRMRLMESESNSHDYVRSMVGAKMAPPLSPRRANPNSGSSRPQTPPTTPPALLSPLPPSSPRLGRDGQLSKSPRGGRASMEKHNRELEVQALKSQLSEYLVERERWVNEINTRQTEAFAARVAAAQLRKIEKELAAENEMLRRRDQELLQRNTEMEEQLKKLTGQQNLSQRIHHHAKIKEENNMLRSQLSASEEELRKERMAKSRALGELYHLRGREGMPAASLYEEEEKLRKQLERAEYEKLMTTQSLAEVCQVVLTASGDPVPKEVHPNSAINAVYSLANRIKHAEHEIDLLRSKERMAEEKKRVAESWQMIRGSPASNGFKPNSVPRSPSAPITFR